MSGLFNKEFAAEHTNETFRTENSNLKKRLIEDIFANSLQSLLRYEDRNAMRFSIEGRVPFLDFRLVRSIVELDVEAIIKDGWNKRILRDATADLLPSLINRRRNRSDSPLRSMNGSKKTADGSCVFHRGAVRSERYVNQASVATAFKAFMEGKRTTPCFFGGSSISNCG
jgi:asparagine synthase (glutamine-hydrolysing)